MKKTIYLTKDEKETLKKQLESDIKFILNSGIINENALVLDYNNRDYKFVLDKAHFESVPIYAEDVKAGILKVYPKFKTTYCGCTTSFEYAYDLFNILLDALNKSNKVSINKIIKLWRNYVDELNDLKNENWDYLIDKAKSDYYDEYNENIADWDLVYDYIYDNYEYTDEYEDWRELESFLEIDEFDSCDILHRLEEKLEIGQI